jgi:hypothetical protein
MRVEATNSCADHRVRSGLLDAQAFDHVIVKFELG